MASTTSDRGEGDGGSNSWRLWPGVEGWSVVTANRQFARTASTVAPVNVVPSMPAPPGQNPLSPPRAPTSAPPKRPDGAPGSFSSAGKGKEEDEQKKEEETTAATSRESSRPAHPTRRAPSLPMPTRAPPPRPKPLSAEETQKRNALIDEFETVLFDCDGVLWLEHELLPGALETIEHLRKNNKRVFFVTNNSTKSRRQYMEKIKSFGIEATVDDILSSSYAAASWLDQCEAFDKTKRKVLYVGERGIGLELDEHGIQNVAINDLVGSRHWSFEEVTSNDTDNDIGAVVVGADWEFTYSKCAFAIRPLQKDPTVLFVSTNQDKTFPVPGGRSLPGGGSVVRMVATAAMQEPINVGKPESWMFELLKEKGVDPATTLMVGDRLDTDIRFGNANGARTLLVLTGVTHEGHLQNEAAEDQPTFVAPSIEHFLAQQE